MAVGYTILLARLLSSWSLFSRQNVDASQFGVVSATDAAVAALA